MHLHRTDARSYKDAHATTYRSHSTHHTHAVIPDPPGDPAWPYKPFRCPVLLYIKKTVKENLKI